jgi:hypothetical protein
MLSVVDIIYGGNMLQIDKEFPIPIAINKNIYPFLDLKIGESFFVVSGKGEQHFKIQNKLCMIARKIYKHTCKKFTTRRDKNHIGIRVWRVI